MLKDREQREMGREHICKLRLTEKDCGTAHIFNVKHLNNWLFIKNYVIAYFTPQKDFVFFSTFQRPV